MKTKSVTKDHKTWKELSQETVARGRGILDSVKLSPGQKADLIRTAWQMIEMQSSRGNSAPNLNAAYIWGSFMNALAMLVAMIGGRDYD